MTACAKRLWQNNNTPFAARQLPVEGQAELESLWICWLCRLPMLTSTFSAGFRDSEIKRSSTK